MAMIQTSSSGISSEPIQDASFSTRTAKLLRTVGYSLLLLSVLDWAAILIPLRLMDPAWEFQTIGALVERVPVPLLGLVFVFYGEMQQRSRSERLVLKSLSWLSLLLGLLYLALIPLAIVNTTRLNETSNTRLAGIYQQQMAQAEKIEQDLTQASPSQIADFIQKQGGNVGELSPDEVQAKVLEELSAAKSKTKAQVETEKQNRWRSLLKNSIKWNLGALISGTSFFYLWRMTRWARSGSRRYR